MEHVEFFEEFMNKVGSLDDQGAIIHSAKGFYRLYGDIFRALTTN